VLSRYLVAALEHDHALTVTGRYSVGNYRRVFAAAKLNTANRGFECMSAV